MILLCKDEIVVNIVMCTQTVFKRDSSAHNAFNTIEMAREYNVDCGIFIAGEVVSNFVKHSQQEAIIEITFHNGITDRIHTDVTTLHLNKGDIDDIVVGLNVKVNSLC